MARRIFLTALAAAVFSAGFIGCGDDLDQQGLLVVQSYGGQQPGQPPVQQPGVQGQGQYLFYPMANNSTVVQPGTSQPYTLVATTVDAQNFLTTLPAGTQIYVRVKFASNMSTAQTQSYGAALYVEKIARQ